MSFGKDDMKMPQRSVIPNQTAAPGRIGIYNANGNPADTADYLAAQKAKAAPTSGSSIPSTQPGGYPTTAQYKTLLGS